MALAATFTGIFNSITDRFIEPIWFSFISLTFSFGLMIDLYTTRNWPKIVIYQILAGVGVGVGPNFQALMLNLQTGVSAQDIAMATAAFGFDRNLASSVGIVVGGVIFQHGIQKLAALLRDALGLAAKMFFGGGAIASTGAVKLLPESQKTVVRSVYQQAIREIWYLTVAFSAVWLLFVVWIRKSVLSREYVGLKTGLQGEEEKRRANLSQETSA